MLIYIYISQKQDERNIYVIMKTMCPPGYHHNGFVTTHAPGYNRESDLKPSRITTQFYFSITLYVFW